MLNALPGPISDAVLRVSAGAGPLGDLFARATLRFGPHDVPAIPDVSTRPIRVAIGPVNEVSQAALWARGIERSNPDVQALAFSVGNAASRRPVDLRVPSSVSIRSRRWQQDFSAFLRAQTHVLNESARPMLGRFKNVDAFAELDWLQEGGVSTALIFHGSDVRDPEAHLRRETWSPFRDSRVPRRLLERRSRETRRRAVASGMPLFVTTPDLLVDVPSAQWCPVVVDETLWQRTPSAPSRVPLVVHAPSSGPMKGTAQITGAMRALEDDGVIRYREVSGVPADAMPEVYADADIVLDQFLIGGYGVAACEAMASGSVVIGHMPPEVREVIRAESGLDLPIVEATPRTLASVVRDLSADPDRRLASGDAGRAFVHIVHSGAFSGRVLSSFLRA